VDDAHGPTPGPIAPRSTSAPTDPAGAPAVRCDEVVIRYGDTVAVDHLTFAAHAGEIVALLGPNGAGKTTTVEALEGYRAVDAGSVAVLGHDPVKEHARVVGHIGVMLQKGGVYPMLGSAQVLRLFAGYYVDAEDPEDLLELVGLAPVRNTPWRRLSGGEQQRLSLALALVGKPKILFLDEPTAGVDPEGRMVVRDIIADRRDQGICVILTTHELAEAERLADHVVIIDHGRALAEGSPAGLSAGRADGSIHFSTDAGIDAGSLAAAIGAGATLTEDRPGSYRLVPPGGVAGPTAVAALTAWLAERDLTLGDLRTGRSLEEAYLAIVGSNRELDQPAPGSPRRQGRRRRGRDQPGRGGTDPRHSDPRQSDPRQSDPRPDAQDPEP
jgi:ABC-2 type transport system ATP-binding protein